MPDAHALARLLRGLAFEPVAAAEDEPVGVLLDVSEQPVDRGLVVWRGEPQRREGSTHHLALCDGQPASATVWHGACLQCGGCRARFHRRLLPHLGEASLVSEQDTVPLLR